MKHLLHRWVRRLSTAVRRPPQPRRPNFRPALETLEDRLTPSVAFAGQITLAVGSFPNAVVVGDFNGDGRPDLALADFNGGGPGTASILLNTAATGASAPSFAAQVTFAAGNGPISVAVGDLNGDGRPDLALANANAGTVSVLFNITPGGAGAPSFAPQVTFTVGAGPTSVAVGDLNGDGKPDLAVANQSGGTVSVLLNLTAAGTTVPAFATQKTFAAGATPLSVAVADFNGDGKPDLAVADESGGTVSLLMDTTASGASVPTFAAPVTFAAGANPFAVAAGDFNGDGKPDLAVANLNSSSVSVLLNAAAAGATAPSFAALQTFAVGTTPNAVAVGDFDGNGRPDLAVANKSDNTVSLLLDMTPAGATIPSFAAQATFTTGNNPIAVAAADFNGDGRPDLAVANQTDNTMSVLANTTTTPFAVTTPVVVADLHGMGVVEYNRLTGQWVQLNPGNPSDVTLLAADANGDVFADYKGYGVARYVPSLGYWKMVNGMDAQALAVDARGDAFFSIAGAGVGLFRLDGSSQLLTPVTATLLSSNAQGDLVGYFAGYGVFRRTAFDGAWRLVNGTDAQAVAIDGTGDVFASFAGAGIKDFRIDGTVQLLTSTAASALSADASGDVTGSVPRQGVVEFRPFTAGRSQSAGLASLVGMDANGDIVAELPGYGVWEFDPFQGWRQLAGADVSLLDVV